MLTVQLAQAFSDIPDVPVPQLDTNVVSIGQQLSQAEASLNAAFAAFQAASAAAPNQSIPPELIQAYTDARAGFVAAVQVWIDGYNQTPVEQRDPNAPNAVPVLPPEISVLSSGFGGAGILPSQVVVKYGPMGREQTSNLVASYYNPQFRLKTPASAGGLGAVPIVPILVLIGIAILATTVVLVANFLTRESDAAVIARADADRQVAVSTTASIALQAWRDLTLKCTNGSTDPAVVAACIQAGTSGAVQVLQSTPQVALSSSGGPSTFAIIGGVVVVAAIIGGGYYLYRRHQQTDLPEAKARSRRELAHRRGR